MAFSSLTNPLTERSSVPALRYETITLAATGPAYSPSVGTTFRGIYVGSAGGTNTLIVTGAGDVTVTFTGILGGTRHDIGGKSVGTSSTATGLIAILD